MQHGILQVGDWMVIGFYFAILLAIGLYYRRFAGRSLDEFFLGGRRNSGWSNGLAYAAALMNADVAPAYSGLAVATGLFVCWFYLSRFGIALFLGAVLFAVFWRRLNLFTTPEFYELRFGGAASKVIRTWVALKSSLLAMVAWTATGLLAMHKIAGPVLGLEKTTTMLIVVPIVVIYILMSGFAGVAATSSVQTLIMLIGSAMLCGIVLWQNGGPLALADQLLASTGHHSVLSAVPPDDNAVLPLAAVLAWLIGTSLGYGGDTAPLGGAMEGQYLFSSKNAREASKMYIVAEVALFLLLLLVTLPSLAAIVHWPQLCLPPDDPRYMDREMAYGLLMCRYLPPGMLGLLFVVMLASVMSTVGSNLTFGAQVLVNDIYRRYLRPNRSERHYLWAGRFAVLLILALALIVVYRVELIFSVATFMVAAAVAEMPANWAQWWWWRFNAWGRLTASFGGILIPVLVWFVPPTSQLHWWEKTYLVVAANMGLTILATIITRPDPWPTLQNFYLAARPLGAWRPVCGRIFRQSAEGAINASPEGGTTASSGLGLILLGLALALFGAGSVMLMIVGLSYLYIGNYGCGLLLLAGFTIGAAVFFRIYGPYLDRLEQRAPPCPQSMAEHPGARPPSDQTGRPKRQGDLKEPISTDVIVTLALVAYGVLLLGNGLIWTRGDQLLLNLLAGGIFLLVAFIVWLQGRRS